MIRILTLNESAEWKAVVSLFKKHDIYDYPEYILPFVQHGDGDAFLFYFENDQGRAMNIFHKRDISLITAFEGVLEKGKFFDIITPYGYGGMRVECTGTVESFTHDLYQAFDGYCVLEGIVAEFARFHPILDNHYLFHQFYETYCVRTTIYMDLAHGVDNIWSSLKNKNRNMIRKAEKSGVKVHSGRLDLWMEEFIQVYYHTMCRNQAKEYYFFNANFFDTCAKGLIENSIVFLAEYDGKIVSVSLILFDENMMHYHLSGTYVEYLHLAVNNLILWEAAKWGCRTGKTIFHLGGGTGIEADDRLLKFKAAFSDQGRAQAYQGMRIFDQDKYDYLVKLRVSYDDLGDFDPNTSFLPKYRA